MTDEERFETLLARYRGATPMPDFRAVQQERHERRRWPYAVAAAIVIAIGIGLVVARPRTLRDGEIVQTNRVRVRVNVPSIGTVDVLPHTTLQLVQSSRDHYLLDLREGSIHAKTKSPPGVFVVNTPRATATDLGCEYTLTVDPSGVGTLHVTAGWVGLRYGFMQSLVPANAHAEMDAAGNLSAPVFDDAPFSAAAKRYALTRDDGSLDTILREARRKDAFTLLNLFPRAANGEQRARIFDRLNTLVPAPPGITREAVRDRWSSGTGDAWWPPVLKASGVSAIKKKRVLGRLSAGPGSA
jgi:ferric-dicitrate binding protein FerR (iron transport regulator)